MDVLIFLVAMRTSSVMFEDLLKAEKLKEQEELKLAEKRKKDAERKVITQRKKVLHSVNLFTFRPRWHHHILDQNGYQPLNPL